MDAETREQQEHLVRNALEQIENRAYVMRECNLPEEFDADNIEHGIQAIEELIEELNDLIYGNDDHEGLVGQ